MFYSTIEMSLDLDFVSSLIDCFVEALVFDRSLIVNKPYVPYYTLGILQKASRNPSRTVSAKK